MFGKLIARFRIEPDVLRFPISLLTAAALAEALIPTLLTKYEYDVSSHRHFVLRRPNRHPDRAKKLRQKLEDRVLREVEGVVQDIQAVLRISDVCICPCPFVLISLMLTFTRTDLMDAEDGCALLYTVRGSKYFYRC
jgi:hypothetical protein